MQTQAVAVEDDEAMEHEAGVETVDAGRPGEEEVMAIVTEDVTEIEIIIEGSAEDTPGAETEDQPSATVTRHPRADRNQHLRIVEAILFATAEPVDVAHLKAFLPDGTDIASLLVDLQSNYINRGVNLVEVAGKWLFRTSDDLSYLLRREKTEERKLSKAAMETLAIIAYHQAVTRAEIEDIRGVAISKGTLDQLLEIGWVRMRGRRKTPGRPVTYGTTDAFLSHFGLNEVGDLPGLQELKGAGLLDANLPPGFDIPMPRSSDDLLPDEDPLDGTETDQLPLEMHLPDQASSEPVPE
ncbi:SMC-Scp complex subunit ScpB [Aestuariivirga sp.]|uniref:SMC-Scp complex subunit ScpB n=1 Tax=Aestuariivirga sp. TaxID=2650926 RepID=UPI0030186E7B